MAFLHNRYTTAYSSPLRGLAFSPNPQEMQGRDNQQSLVQALGISSFGPFRLMACID